MKLNDRLIKLIKLMYSETDYKQLSYYADALMVSERTIQNDLDEIEKLDVNFSLKIDRKQNVGILLKGSQDQVNSFIKEYSNGTIDTEGLERRAKIMKILAIEKKTVTYQKLSEMLYSSSSVIIKDIQSIKSLNIKNANIVSDRSGTRLEASEYYTQKLLKAFFLDFVKQKDLESNRRARGEELKRYFQDIVVNAVYEIIDEIEDVINHQITDYYLISLEIMLLVITERVFRGHHFDRDVNALSEDYFETLTNFPFALDVANKIHGKLQVEFNEEEIRYLSYQMFIHRIELNINNKYLESAFEDDVQNIIRLVSEDVGVNLLHDDRLYNSLMFHIVPLVYRVKSNVKIENPLYEEVLSADTKLFYSIWMAMKPFEEKYRLTLNNDEVSFLSIHFQVSLARTKFQQKAYVVCETGLLTSELLTSKIRQNLPSSLTIVPISKKDLYDKKKIDANFIISTIELEKRYEPYIKVSLLMNDTDMRNIYDYYLKYGDHVYLSRETLDLRKDEESIINEKFVFTNYAFETKGALFEHAEQVLREDKIVDKEFLKSVLAREAAGSTMIAENVALPHSNPQLAVKTQLLIYTLQKPISWDQNHEAQVIFLLVLSDVDGNGYLDTFLSLHEYVSDYKNVVKLLKMDRQEIVKVLERL